MKKIFTFIFVLALMLIAPISTHAENNTWFDQSFDFSQISKLQVTQMEVRNTTRGKYYRTDPSAQRYVEQLLQQVLQKKNIQFISAMGGETNKPAAPFVDPLGRLDTLSAEVIIHEYASSKYYVPEQVTQYTVYEEIIHVDRYGRESKTRIPVVKTKVTPAYWNDVAYADLEILLYNPTNNKNVFNYRDTRDRTSENNPYSMTKRITESFANKVEEAKKYKKTY